MSKNKLNVIKHPTMHSLLDFGIRKVYFYLCLYTKSLFHAIRLTNSPFISSLRVIMQRVVDRSRLHDL